MSRILGVVELPITILAAFTAIIIPVLDLAIYVLGWDRLPLGTYTLLFLEYAQIVVGIYMLSNIISGLTTQSHPRLVKLDRYCSWIGAALVIGTTLMTFGALIMAGEKSRIYEIVQTTGSVQNQVILFIFVIVDVLIIQPHKDMVMRLQQDVRTAAFERNPDPATFRVGEQIFHLSFFPSVNDPAVAREFLAEVVEARRTGGRGFLPLVAVQLPPAG